MAPSRRRVLHLIDTGGPGGAETIFLELVTGLPDLGFESIPVVPVDDWLAGALRDRGLTAYELKSHNTLDVSYARELRHLIARERVDLVQTHLLTTGVYGTAASWGTGRPVVSTFHGYPDVSFGEPASSLKLGILGRGLNRVVFVSEFLRALFRDQGGFHRKTAAVIPNGIDCSIFSPGDGSAARASLGIPRDAPLVGAVGNIRPSKAYDVLLRAFARVRKAVPSAHLVVVGQPTAPLYDELLSIRTELALEAWAHFVGFRADVPEVLRAFDVLAISSHDEGFSLAAVQAMATGRPVVATRCGGPESILVDGSSGLLVAPSDPQALADGVVRVLEHRGLSERLGRAARERALEGFSIERMLRGYADLYERALRDR